jgi:hypothetical protein
MGRPGPRGAASGHAARGRPRRSPPRARAACCRGARARRTLVAAAPAAPARRAPRFLPGPAAACGYTSRSRQSVDCSAVRTSESGTGGGGQARKWRGAPQMPPCVPGGSANAVGRLPAAAGTPPPALAHTSPPVPSARRRTDTRVQTQADTPQACGRGARPRVVARSRSPCGLERRVAPPWAPGGRRPRRLERRAPRGAAHPAAARAAAARGCPWAEAPAPPCPRRPGRPCRPRRARRWRPRRLPHPARRGQRRTPVGPRARHAPRRARGAAVRGLPHALRTRTGISAPTAGRLPLIGPDAAARHSRAPKPPQPAQGRPAGRVHRLVKDGGSRVHVW